MENKLTVINLICKIISWFFWYIKTFFCGGDIFTVLYLTLFVIKHKMDWIREMLLYGTKSISVAILWYILAYRKNSLHLTKGQFCCRGDIHEIWQTLYFIWANSSPTNGSALLQFCCIITDSKPFLRYNKQVNHWLKWDKFVVDGTHHNNGNVPKDDKSYNININSIYVN